MSNILKNIGLCSRAGGLITGEEFVLEAIKKQSVLLVFLANDASDNTTKRIKDKTNTYNVDINIDFSTEELSKAIGKENRKVIGITDKGFAKLLKK